MGVPSALVRSAVAAATDAWQRSINTNGSQQRQQRPTPPLKLRPPRQAPNPPPRQASPRTFLGSLKKPSKSHLGTGHQVKHPRKAPHKIKPSQRPGASLHPGAAKSMPYMKRLHTFNDPKQNFPRLKTDVTKINGAFKVM